MSISASAAGAILTIDLGAICENYRRLKAQLGGVRCAGVVKADAYGLGAAEVARALALEGCDTFFVAHVAEGMALRGALGEGPAIYVLNGIPNGAEQDAALAGLRAVLNSIEQVRAWQMTGRRLGKALPAALQVDSGMARLGMPPSEVDALADDPQGLEGIDLSLMMSHLACADEPEHPANRSQRASFESLRKKLPAAPASLANSSGIFLGRDYHYDLARPGAALYGVNPTPHGPNPMRQVLGLSAKVIQTRDLPAGIGVGYGHTLRTTAAMPVATISLGYADGWPRHAGGCAWFDGVRLPFAGRVSMDSIILDISGLAPGRLKADDLVALIGPEQSVDDVATVARTIGYEILTGLGYRFHRRYTRA
jgi:alanine racemase